MRVVLGILMVVGGIALGVYVGIWVCFVGGIVDIIEQVQATHVVATTVAWGIAKIFFAGLLGWLSALVLVIPGFAFIASHD